MYGPSSYDRDNVSQKSQGHTYTPGSHENLLRSHLELDKQKQSKLQGELKRLAFENEMLKRDLNDAQNDIRDKDEKIFALNNELLKKPKTNPPLKFDDQSSAPLYELEGKPVTLDGLINHFKVVIQRHHDLLRRKNQEILNLQDALDRANKNPPEVQDSLRRNNVDVQDLLDELSRVRKEYEASNYILSERNKKLEDLIDSLQNKLDEYSREIQELRNQLAATPVGPSESTMALIKSKEKENEQLRELIKQLENKNLKLNNIQYEIREVVRDKERGVNNINDIIEDMKKQPSAPIYVKPDVSDLEKDCQRAINDLNDTNKKMNDLLNRLKELPDKRPTDTPMSTKKDLVPNLENVKHQCEDQIDSLKKLLGAPEEKPYRSELVYQVAPSKENFFVKDPFAPVEFVPPTSPKRTTEILPTMSSEHSPFKSPVASIRYMPETEPPKLKRFPTETCEACDSINFEPEERIPEPYKPDPYKVEPKSEPYKVESKLEPHKPKPKQEPYKVEPKPEPHKPKHKQEPKVEKKPEFYNEPEPRKRLLGDDNFYPQSPRSQSREGISEPSRDKAKTPKKSGCCGKKPSETSTQYQKPKKYTLKEKGSEKEVVKKEFSYDPYDRDFNEEPQKDIPRRPLRVSMSKSRLI